ncbi:MAG: 4Fe-4S binding protein [Synergistaceae bacterium]|nr:4Fe-4S binding protein [Synergistaceae bacterium]MDD2350601.1 4Fe-4S binding protein [Synergistaceae bacterium]MDD3318742.1 4Fe-4S binding protein [Synergistaceae bacterium]MDD3673546.1 4Fe-4S binding protein [Synergistaceae bacterium]MDD3964345.1 4Fe-4S binding protein [Synergistaceae bacterium]
MKVLQLRTEKCVQCGECMSACSKAWFKEDNPSLSRIKIENKATYPNINVCNQCGACIEICPTKALERDANGIVQVRKDKCTSCLMCVGFCPSASMFFDGAKQTEPFKCISCGICAKACPTGALELITTPEPESK